MASVTLNAVGKDYESTTIIPRLDLEIADGEFIVLVGPSGCGKSTALRMVAGLETVTRGEILIDGRCVNETAPRERDVAMVFQSYALYPHMTVRDNLGFALKLAKQPPAQINARVTEVAEMLGLETLLARYPRQLSGGQRQRVAMGRAIVRRPKVFLFDEPLSNLDASLRSKLRVELKKLHQNLKTTMIYVTHDQVEAMTLADRIVVLKDGLAQQVGTPHELYLRPTNRFVAGFIGTPPMNFFEARISEQTVRAEGIAVATTLGETAAVTLGIRPLDMRIDPQATSYIEGLVDVIEPLGGEAHLHGSVSGQPFTVQVDAAIARELRTPARLRFSVDPQAAHLFDSAGQRLEG